MSHGKLFARLYAYGIRGDVLTWLKNFLSGRTHRTKVGRSLSDISGVVHGRGVGPVMFIIFIDDLAKLLEQYGITAKLFADDVKVYFEISGADDVAKLQATLDLIAGWSCNSLVF